MLLSFFLLLGMSATNAVCEALLEQGDHVVSCKMVLFYSVLISQFGYRWIAERLLFVIYFEVAILW